ncbi:MAG TPA: hypothetical protein VK484_11075 [Ferruginibacter sp.]|nr:hypothetical protein [Ferruginibacter sp.]
MKTAILLFAAIVGVISFTGNNKDIRGTWSLQIINSGCSKTILRINMGEGAWEGKLDIPEQEVYDKKVHSIRMSGDSVFITVFKNGSTINAKMVNDSSMTGIMQLEGCADEVLIKKI